MSATRVDPCTRCNTRPIVAACPADQLHRGGDIVHRHDVKARGTECRKEAERPSTGQEVDQVVENLEPHRRAGARVAHHHAGPMHGDRQAIRDTLGHECFGLRLRLFVGVVKRARLGDPALGQDAAHLSSDAHGTDEFHFSELAVVVRDAGEFENFAGAVDGRRARIMQWQVHPHHCRTMDYLGTCRRQHFVLCVRHAEFRPRGIAANRVDPIRNHFLRKAPERRQCSKALRYRVIAFATHKQDDARILLIE